MKIFLLFLLISTYLFSQEQVKWVNEGSNSEIKLRYRLENENRMIFLSVVNGQTTIQYYDYENNETVSNFNINEAKRVNLSYNNSILIINEDPNKILRYNFNGELLNEYQLTTTLYEAIEYDEGKVITRININGEVKVFQYDLIEDKIISEITNYDLSHVSNNYYIDNKLFINASLKDNSRITLTYDLENKEFLNPLNGINSLVRSFQIFDNSIITIHQQRESGFLTQMINKLDRNTLEIIESHNIKTDDDFIEVVNENDPIVVRVDSNFTVQEYNFKSDQVIQEIRKDFLHPHCMKLNDGYYFGYNFWGNYFFNIYDNDFKDIHGKSFAVSTNAHNGPTYGVKIVGDKIITASEDGSIIEWNYDGDFLNRPVQINELIFGLDYSPKHNLVGITAGNFGGKLQIFDATTWELKFEKIYPEIIQSIRFNDELDKFIIMGHDTDIEIFNSNDFSLINTIENKKTDSPFDFPCSALLLDEERLAYTYQRGLVIHDYANDVEIYSTQLYQTQGLSPTLDLEKDKNNNRIIVSSYDQSIFIYNYDDDSFETIKPNFTDINGKSYLGFKKYKSSFINDSLVYILGQQHLIVYNLNTWQVEKEYNQMNPSGYTEFNLVFRNFDYNNDIVVAVNSYGGVFGLIPYQVVAGIENKIINNLVYPNPVKTNFKLNLDYFDELLIFDLNGLIVKKISYNSNEVSASDLANGVYYIRIKKNNEYIYSKFIKE